MQITMMAVFAEYMDGWRCLQITMMAVFADHDDGGVCMAMLVVLHQTQFKTMTLGTNNIHTSHVHTVVLFPLASWRFLL